LNYFKSLKFVCFAVKDHCPFNWTYANYEFKYIFLGKNLGPEPKEY